MWCGVFRTIDFQSRNNTSTVFAVNEDEDTFGVKLTHLLTDNLTQLNLLKRRKVLFLNSTTQSHVFTLNSTTSVALLKNVMEKVKQADVDSDGD